MGEWKDKVEGKIAELKGKVTDDKSEELKGKAQQTLGSVKGKMKNITDAVGGRDAASAREGSNPPRRDPTASADETAETTRDPTAPA